MMEKRHDQSLHFRDKLTKPTSVTYFCGVKLRHLKFWLLAFYGAEALVLLTRNMSFKITIVKI